MEIEKKYIKNGIKRLKNDAVEGISFAASMLAGEIINLKGGE